MTKKYTIVGIDEAGRGPLAGPVVAAAVIIEEKHLPNKINDSKKVSERNRDLYYKIIIEKAWKYSFGIIQSEEIDNINIHEATLKAMQISHEKLNCSDTKTYVDGIFKPKIEGESFAIKHGDRFVPIISAASILAKVARDKIMLEIDKEFPSYDFKNNKGYPTKKHIEMIKKHGICKYHRKTFKPIKYYEQ
jgi:ribonuclease HII